MSIKKVKINLGPIVTTYFRYPIYTQGVAVRSSINYFKRGIANVIEASKRKVD